MEGWQRIAGGRGLGWHKVDGYNLMWTCMPPGWGKVVWQSRHVPTNGSFLTPDEDDDT